MLRSPGWSRGWRAVVLTVMAVSLSPSGPAHGQVVRAPVPAGGALGAGPIVPRPPGPGPLGPGPLAPTGPGPLAPTGPGPLTPTGPARALSAPPGNPLSATPTGTPAANPATTIPRHGRAQRAADRARMRVVSAVKTIGEQNRQGAAIVLKTRRVTP
jgi:hypothetical protein